MTTAAPGAFAGETSNAARPNPFIDPRPFNRVTVAGVLVVAVLVKFNGISVEDKWKAQKSKETSGMVNVFAGTDPVGGEGGFKLTFRAYDIESFDQLYDIYNALAPVPVLTTTAPATTSTSSAPTSSIGSPPSTAEGLIAQAQASLAQLSNPSAAAQTATDAGASSTPSAGPTDNPGPRPPTVPIDNALLAFMGVTSVARKSWAWEEGPGLSWDVTIGFLVDKPPVPAGAGAMTPPVSTSSTITLPANAFGSAGGSVSSLAGAEAAGT